MEVLPKLYKLSKTGSVQEWEIKVVERDDGTVNMVTTHGQKDGKMQTEQREIKGKNAGRSNETTPFKQGVQEARKKWEDKKKSGYHEDADNVSEVTVLPMLAKRYDESSHKIEVPYAIQPKLDGMRALIYLDSKGVVKIISRLGNSIDTVPHINNEIQKLDLLKKGLYLDGELYTTEYPFEELVGLLKSGTVGEDKAAKLKYVKFYAFDYFDLGNLKMKFIDRFKILREMIEKKKPQTMILVETKIGKVLSDTVSNKVRDQYLKRGYEGVMFRNLKSVYAVNKRSSDLIKHKKTLDAEFEITGFEEGKGRDKGTAIFLLKTAKGDEFKARPTGTIEDRQKMFERAEKLVGKMATVEYQELSQKGVPRFPVLVRIRETME
jgi:DNA ligase 1